MHAVRKTAVSLLLCLGLLAGTACGGTPAPSTPASGGTTALPADSFLQFNGEEIPLEEYRLFARDGITIIQGQYAQSYGVQDFSGGFWQTEFDGTTPMDALKAYAEENLREQKGLQHIAREYGLAGETSYEAFLTYLEETNLGRSEAKDSGEVVYGPVNFTAETLYSYRQAEYYYLVLEHIMYNVLNPSTEELRSFYDTLKEETTLYNFSAECAYFHWPTTEDDEAIVAALEAAATDGQTPEAMAENAGATTGVPVSHVLQTVDTRDLGKEDYDRQRVVWMLEDVEPGQHTGAYVGDSATSVVWVLAKQREEMGPFEENMDYAEAEYRESEAKRIIAEKTAGYTLEYAPQYASLTYEMLTAQEDS